MRVPDFLGAPREARPSEASRGMSFRGFAAEAKGERFPLFYGCWLLTDTISPVMYVE